MFPTDLTAQKGKLMTMIATAVTNLHQVDKIVPAVQDLGRRHVGYGVTAAHYKPVGEALIWTLEKGLGDGFTPPMGMRVMLSTPPTRTRGASPARTRAQAIAVASRLLAHMRVRVMAGVRSGRPAESAIARATFRPCSTSGYAQPTTTSSTASRTDG